MSDQKREKVESALRKHDRVKKVEEQRLSSGIAGRTSGGRYQSYYNTFNLLPGLKFEGDGCRCCYDPYGDGGEYELLAKAKEEKMQRLNNSGGRVEEGDEEENDKIKQRKDETDSTVGTNDSDDDEYDYLLDDEIDNNDGPMSNYSSTNSLMAQRRAELEDIVHRREVARYHGYGVHRQMSPSRIFASVGWCNQRHSHDRRPPPQGAVIHLYDPNLLLSVSLDLCLEEMSCRYPGTKFVRGHGKTTIPFSTNKGGGGVGSSDDGWTRADLPILLALRDGEIITWSSGLRDFRCAGGGEDSVESDAVERWLDRAGSLILDLPNPDELCGIRPEEDALLMNMRQLNGLGRRNEISVGDGQDDYDHGYEHNRYDCGLVGCNKTFVHEHVGIKTDTHDGLLVAESQVAASSADPV